MPAPTEWLLSLASLDGFTSDEDATFGEIFFFADLGH
jgi:hypothetical protein